MIKNIILFSFLSFVLACKKEETHSTALQQNSAHKPDYSEFKKELSLKTISEKKELFFKYINYDVPYYWKGTPWSFNGTSNVPKKGSVACGYFVTNNLMNYGFDIKGNYLAQQASSVMIKQLCTDISYFSKREDLEKYLLNNNKNQVYIVGLDFHTGFITRENKDIYFIHSSYIDNEGVVKEKTAVSPALNASETYMIGNLKFK